MNARQQIIAIAILGLIAFRLWSTGQWSQIMAALNGTAAGATIGGTAASKAAAQNTAGTGAAWAKAKAALKGGQGTVAGTNYPNLGGSKKVNQNYYGG